MPANPVLSQAAQISGRPTGNQVRGQRPGITNNVVGQVGQPTGVKSNNDLLGLVESMAAKQKLASGAATQARGEELFRTDKWTGHKSWRNALAGSILSYRGDKRISEAMETEAGYQDDQAEARARAAAQYVLAQGGSQAQADAAYEATRAGLDTQGLGEFGPAEYDLGEVNALQKDYRMSIGDDFALSLIHI